MCDIEFKVWCKRTKTMTETSNWFVLSQGGRLMSYGPIRPLRYEDKEHYEILQFIGLKDKDGIKLFEGDIVKTSNTDDYVYIKYSNIVPAFTMIQSDKTEYIPTINDWDNIKVVGNIYENPELLKETELSPEENKMLDKSIEEEKTSKGKNWRDVIK